MEVEQLTGADAQTRQLSLAVLRLGASVGITLARPDSNCSA